MAKAVFPLLTQFHPLCDRFEPSQYWSLQITATDLKWLRAAGSATYGPRRYVLWKSTFPPVCVVTMANKDPAEITEKQRLAALAQYRGVDTPREGGFDDLVTLAAEICGTPIAVINLIETDRQWFKAKVGLGVDSMPLETSFCGTAILEEDFMLIPDATKDERFVCNPLVTTERGLRFYAGALLKSPNGLPIGTLSVLDYKPRSISEFQQRALYQLARQVMAQLELRRAILES